VSFDWNVFATECTVALLAVRADGSVAFANRAASTLLGYDLAELERATAASLVPAAFHPAPGASWIGHLFRLAEKSGATASALPVTHRSGAAMESEWTVLEGRDETGAEVGVLMLAQRSTSLADLQEDVASVHRAIFENAPLGIFYFDVRGVITACNERFASTIGSEKRRIIGLHGLTLKNEGVVRAIADCCEGKHAEWEGDYTSVTGGKRVRGVRLVTEPIKNANGEVVAGIGLVEDVTDQHRAREVVARTERLASLGTFAAGVALDVEAPLALALANIELAARRLEESSDASKDELESLLAHARDGVNSVVETFRRLKTISRGDAALRAEVDVTDLVHRLIADLDPKLTEGVALSVDARPVGAVLANELQLGQAVHALLSNALHAVASSPAGARSVVVRVSPASEECMRIEIEDTGCGVPPGASAHIFEPFWTDREGGQGLGLALAQGVVSSLGGALFLDETRPSTVKGARFVMTLPTIPGGTRAGPPPSVPPKRAHTMPPPHRGRVLVVDDEERLASTLRLALSGTYDVDIATRGRQAIAMLKDHDYDVILCDLSLPDVSGVDVFEETRRERPEIGARFVFLTGGAFQSRTRAFLQSVDNARLDKPFDLDALEKLLAARVAALLEG